MRQRLSVVGLFMPQVLHVLYVLCAVCAVQCWRPWWWALTLLPQASSTGRSMPGCWGAVRWMIAAVG